MGWVKLSDDFMHHPKVLQVGPNGIALYVAGLCYCNRYLTDGKIPAAAIPTLVDFTSAISDADGPDASGVDLAEGVAQSLVDAGLWHRLTRAYRVHDFDQYQPSRAKVLAERERERAKKSRQRSPGDSPVDTGRKAA